jgi:hypothetical protein
LTPERVHPSAERWRPPTRRAASRPVDFCNSGLLFEGERLDGYRLWIEGTPYGTSWDDGSEEKELARRDAQDVWLAEMLGVGVRVQRPSGSALTYSFPWGEVWSGYDPRSAGSDIGVRFRRSSG